MNAPEPLLRDLRALPARPARRLALGGLAGGIVLASGCAGVDPSTYRSEKPVLDLRTYFDGDIDAWGVFQDRSGQVVRRFTVKMKCSWVGDTGTLDEDFIYSDGKKEKRVWTVRRQPEGRWIGTAADVVGEARGVSSGNALNWRYTLALNVDGTVWNVDFDDWMYLIDERVMLNRATMSKFGIRLGEVLLSFTKR
ncbi:MAG: DUF3833 domain-containing protein [Burkholderiales bacterium]|nr:MAG: DUF3833 domain-containing protein [Burkholderiales bacterium]